MSPTTYLSTTYLPTPTYLPHPSPRVQIPLAALFAADPTTDRPVLYDILCSAKANEPVEAARWFERHCQVGVRACVQQCSRA